MNCRDAHDLLQQSLDGAPIESPEWLAHLRHCAECRALASAGRRLQDGLRFFATPELPPDLAERIVDLLQLDRRRARRQLRRRWAVGLGLAAGLLLALTGIIHLMQPVPLPVTANPQQQLPSDTATANRQRQAPAGSPAREPAEELSEVFAELSNETAKAGEGLSEGLEPVANSARRAVDLFLRELPMETKTN
jgi:anti-sigma factor RsiW